MIKTLIVEDEISSVNELSFLLSRQSGFLKVGSCGSIEEAKILLNTLQPDLVLMDVELEDGNAFELLQSLQEIRFQTIFITAYNEYAIKAIKFSALDYIVKPVDEQEFGAALRKINITTNYFNPLTQQVNLAREYLSPTGVPNRIALKDQYHLRIVSYDEIIYCQSNSSYTTFYLVNGKNVVVSRSIKEHERLLSPLHFLRIHQSYIVNINHIELYHKEGYIVLKNGLQVPVAARKREEIMKKLLMGF